MIIKRQRFYLIIFLLFISAKLVGQDSLYLFRGQVLSEEGNYEVALAHVINVQQKWGVVTDTLGVFEIWANRGDTLNISAIGFYYKEYTIKEIITDSVVNIFLKGRTYEIPEVAVIYLGTYNEFKQKVLDLELPESPLSESAKSIFKHVEKPLFVEPSIGSPISMLYYAFSKEGKDIRKYLDLKENESERDEILERFNIHVIKNLTGLEEFEAREFMAFCNFQDDYILNITDYRLYADILEHFEAFKKSKQDSLKTD